MSHERADIRSTQLVDQARASVTGFIEAGRLAVYEIQSDIDRTIQWLRDDRASHWKRAVRRRTEEMNRAKQNLARKQARISSKDSRVPDSEEKLLLRKAQARLESAVSRQQKTMMWIRKLEQERILLMGYLGPVTLILEGDMPQAAAVLHKIGETLDEYVALSPNELKRALVSPSAEGPEPADETGEGES